MITKSHLGMKLIGVLTIIGAILMIIAGVTLAYIGQALTQTATEAEGWEGIITLIPLFSVGVGFAAMAIPMVIIGVLLIIYGIFVYKERTWAYVLLWILSILGIIGGILAFNMWSILVSALILVYVFIIRKDFFGGSRGIDTDYREA